MRHQLLLTLLLAVAAVAIVGLGAAVVSAGTVKPAITLGAVGADPNTGKLDFIVQTKRADKVVVFYQAKRYLAVQHWKNAWLVKTGLPLYTGHCYTYQVIAYHGKQKKSLTFQSKTDGRISSFCNY